LILLTPGDPAGIGPEITWKVFSAKGKRALTRRFPGFRFACVGATAPFEKLGAKILQLDENSLDQEFKHGAKTIPFISAPAKAPSASIHLEGFQSGWSIEKAARLIQCGRAQALVTGPISKERLQRGGYAYSGHTDFLAALCDAGEVTMMLANDRLRISLVTVHIGLRDVPKNLTRERLRRAVLHTVEHLQSWWGIARPRIAIAGLNPHAGENGLFGDEEIRVISPEIEALQSGPQGGNFKLIGPLPADTLFANHVMARPIERFDAVVCMYHDQGLIPVKLLDFPHTVNVTLGLPIVRTSVDHGVAFDIAGKGKADPSSLESAIELAVKIVKNRLRKKRK
jgi:4-hydroxythreonine-4-phosphate dehydrogenase